MALPAAARLPCKRSRISVLQQHSMPPGTARFLWRRLAVSVIISPYRTGLTWRHARLTCCVTSPAHDEPDRHTFSAQIIAFSACRAIHILCCCPRIHDGALSHMLTTSPHTAWPCLCSVLCSWLPPPPSLVHATVDHSQALPSVTQLSLSRSVCKTSSPTSPSVTS